MRSGLGCLGDLMLHLGVKTARDDFRRRLGESTLDDLGLLVRYMNDPGGEVVENVIVGFG